MRNVRRLLVLVVCALALLGQGAGRTPAMAQDIVKHTCDLGNDGALDIRVEGPAEQRETTITFISSAAQNAQAGIHCCCSTIKGRDIVGRTCTSKCTTDACCEEWKTTTCPPQPKPKAAPQP